jgi:hypothetical protein
MCSHFYASFLFCPICCRLCRHIEEHQTLTFSNKKSGTNKVKCIRIFTLSLCVFTCSMCCLGSRLWILFHIGMARRSEQS